MIPQSFQPGELRNDNNEVIRAGTYGRYTPFISGDNRGILDYIMNNFDALHDLCGTALQVAEVDEIWEDN